MCSASAHGVGPVNVGQDHPEVVGSGVFGAAPQLMHVCAGDRAGRRPGSRRSVNTPRAFGAFAASDVGFRFASRGIATAPQRRLPLPLRQAVSKLGVQLLTGQAAEA